MASRDLKHLSPAMQKLAYAHKAICALNGIDLLIYCTHRPNKEQDELYAIGRTVKGEIVTNARGGQSKHNHTATTGLPDALAYDCVPCINGKPQWSDKRLYAKVGALGEEVGLVWAGRWTGSLRETAHFELPK